jgi:hypothetical protein
LDRILDRLLGDGIVDHVRTVDMTPALVRDVMGRYFQHEGDRVHTHAATGGPIYATLFGLELMATDCVLQMDADVLFYAGHSSWVEQALQVLARDPRIWLMMTHPGPPAGPPGHKAWDREIENAPSGMAIFEYGGFQMQPPDTFYVTAETYGTACSRFVRHKDMHP